MITARLKNADVVDRWAGLPGWLSQIVFALLCSAAMVMTRIFVDTVAPGAGPYALMFPAVLVATIFGRALAGALTLVMLVLFTWYFVLPPARSFVFAHPADAGRTLVNFLAGVVILFFAEAIRRAFRKAVDERDARIADQDLFLKEIDHRVKNNFALVAGLLGMQRRQMVDEKAKEALSLAESRIAGIARAHTHLYGGGSGTGAVDMHAYLTGLCDALSDVIAAQRGITLTCDCQAAALPRDRAVGIGMVVNELVTNAAKHAFVDRLTGTVHIAFQKEQGGYVLIVHDNGVGLPSSVRDGALGQRLIQAFAQQANGELTAQSDNTGTSFTLRMPA